MPIDSRIEWQEKEDKLTVKVKGSLGCTFCHNVFEREVVVSNNKNNVWKAKEDISEVLGQHNHGI